MELRDFADQILDGATVEAKTRPPEGGLAALTDEAPGPALPWRAPARAPGLEIAPKQARLKMPSAKGFSDPVMRARALHTFANHELMALELMAWALRAWPEAPPAFRKGLGWLMVEEQRHLLLYVERLEALGVPFGSLPLNDHFWRLAPELTTPARWVCAMNLTLEQANLDHAPQYAAWFEQAGDHDSAALMAQIERDEVRHVAFGATWLPRLDPHPTRTLFERFEANLTGLNTPGRARGKQLNEAARRAAGLDDDFIVAMRAASRE